MQPQERIILRGLAALAVVGALLAAGSRAASAHGHVEVGDYELVIGFSSEPAYQGEPNGLDLLVTRKVAAATGATPAGEAAEHTHAEGAVEVQDTADEEATAMPVNDLADSLKAELIFGDARKELVLEPQWGEEGAYTAYVLPTAPGDYTWRIFGTIEDTPVDVSMASGPDTFSAVEPKTTVAFPAAEPALADLQASIDEGARMVRLAFWAGLGGLVLGVIAIALVVLRR
jgi:hypothetical protein